MKNIINWRDASVADVESDGLLEEATKLHVLSCQLNSGKKVDVKGSDFKTINKFINHHLNNNIPLVGHNFICFDIPLLEKLFDMDLSKLMVIDTLSLSWYLNIEREKHGLDSFFEDYGIAKPPITDWEGLSYDEYRHRCCEDVNINKELWEDFKTRLIDMYSHVKEVIDKGLIGGKRVSDDEVLHIDSLKGLSVDEHISRILTFLMNKTDMARLREKTRIKIDVDLLDETDKELTRKVEEATKELESVMPQVPKYKVKKKPSKPLKQDGTVSASGASWNKAIDGLDQVDDMGNPLSIFEEDKPDQLKIFKEYEQPNINSSSQVKDWLFMMGWKPKTFKYVKDKEKVQAWVDSGFKKELKPKPRAIPQISVEGDEGKELCESVLKLAERYSEINAYSGYTLIKHRYDVVQGFKSELSEDGYIKARVGGYANTIREKHRKPVANLPNPKKPYGKHIRGFLTCAVKQIMMGSDLSSLEDRIKNGFCLAHDPDYVESVSMEGYDPHLYCCLNAGMVTQQEYDDWTIRDIKSKNAERWRPVGKCIVYASVYGAAAETIAREAGIPLEDAKAGHTAYWKIHSYVKSIAEDQYTFYCGKGYRWLINPINGFCYSIRSEKDIFSTLIQGTGSFCFDMWIDNIVESMYELWGRASLSLLYHDEFAVSFNDTEKMRKKFTDITKDAIMKVNKDYLLRIDLDCDIQFGKNYSEIH